MSLQACSCGKEVTLRVTRISVNRKCGVTHWIQHVDGTKPCVHGDWSSAALKPYHRDETQRPYALLMAKWNELAASQAQKGDKC